MTKTDNVVGISAFVVSSIFTSVQTNELFQIISLIVTSLAGIVSLTYSIYKWVKSAKKDGKIDKKEVDELAKIVDNGVSNLADSINNIVGDGEEKEGDTPNE